MKRTICILLSFCFCLGAFLLPAAAEDPAEKPAAAVTEAPAEPLTTLPAQPAADEPTAVLPPETEPATSLPAQELTTTAIAVTEPTTAAPEPPAAQTTEGQEETAAAPESTDAQAAGVPPLSPYAPPDWHDYEGTGLNYEDVYDDWESSAMGRYYNWRMTQYYGDREAYDPAFRAFYADDPDLKIKDHLVYRLTETETWVNRQRVKQTYAVILDYFDTDEAAQATATLRIPATLDGCPTSTYMYLPSEWSAGMSDSCYTNDTVKKLVLEEGITSIGMYAFSHFTALKKVVLPSSLEQIGIGAFRACNRLKKVTGKAKVQVICSDAFNGCEALCAFPNMETLQTIEGAAFRGCAFKTLTLSGKLFLGGGDEDHYSVGSAFADCKRLKQVTFLDAGKKDYLNIGEQTFQNCAALRTVVLPKRCKMIWIDDQTFQNCTALRSVENIGKVDTVGRMAFQNCTALQGLTLPKKLRRCDFDAFLGCKSLKTLTLLSENTELFDVRYDPGTLYEGDPSGYFLVTGNFLLSLPKTCKVLVVSKAMKDAVQTHGFKGTVQVSVKVAAPKTVKADKKNGNATVRWSRVKNADGYRVWAYNPKTGQYTKLATVGAAKTAVTVRSAAAVFAVRAYRIVDKDVSWSAIRLSN